MRGLFFPALLLMITAGFCHAQEIKSDTLTNKLVPADTSFIQGDKQIIEIESASKRFDPRKALLYSAVFPGAGQFYNKKYWKMPIVYGGFAVLISITNFYNEENLRYRTQLFDLVNDPTPGGLSTPDLLTEDQLRTLVDRTRRERDFFLIMNGLWYILQMVDAHVDAHLKEFDVNPKMQVSLEPMMENSMMTGRNTGITLRIKF